MKKYTALIVARAESVDTDSLAEARRLCKKYSTFSRAAILRNGLLPGHTSLIIAKYENGKLVWEDGVKV